eukprot:scaffold9.g3154.t1
MPPQAPLLDVQTTPWGMEYSIHEVQRQHRDVVAAVFPGESPDGMLVVPTCQQASVDLVGRGEQVETEKDRLLERVRAYVCARLAAAGHWADYIDPCSGLPMVHRETGSMYGEVDALATLLGYHCQNAGCCKVVLHPRWGSAVYPATLFAKAPAAEVAATLAAAAEELAPRLC